MAVNLSAGSVEMLCTGDYKGSEIKPVLQVTDVRIVQAANSSSERYRLLLSDGLHLLQGMLATQINHLVKSDRLKKGSIIQLDEFVCNRIQQRVIIIIVKMDVILEQCDNIGDPKHFPIKGDGATLPTSTSNPPAVVHSTTTHQTSSNTHNPGGNLVSGGVMPKENVGIGSYMQAPGLGQSSVPSSYSSSVTNKTESGQYNLSTSSLGYSRPESASGLSRAPLNSPVRPIQPSYPQPIQPSYHQPPPMYENRGPVAKNEASPRIIPIAALNPYQGRWTIKARVTAKGVLRHYSNQRGEGKVFSFDLLDSEGGEIRATCFNAAADQFYHQIEDGKVYLVSKGTLKPAQRNFNHLPNDHEIMLDSSSTVQACEDENLIPQQRFQFRSLIEIEGMENNTIIDVIGVLCSISPTTPIMRKNGTETLKRALQIKDMSGRSVEVTLWGDFCNSEGQTLQNICDSGVFPVVAVKSGKVNDFIGKSIGTIPTSKVIIQPDIPEASKLKAWFENEGKNAPVVSLSRDTTGMGRQDVRKTVSQIKDEKLGTSEKPDWITVSATLSYLKTDNFCYTACPIKIGDRQCSKKVINNGDGKWRCERCDQSVDECDYRYILQFQIQDHTGLTWVTAFQECGEEILAISAKELYFLKNEEQDDERFAEIVRRSLFQKYLFKLKVKEETFSDEQRVKSTVVKVDKLNFTSETNSLLDLLKLKGEDSTYPALKSENVILNTGMNNVASGNVGFREPAQANVNYTGNISTGIQGSGLPASQVGHYGNHNVGSRVASTGPTSTNYTGVLDGQEHYSHGGGVDSRTVSAGSGGGSSKECFKCHQHGHWARDCPMAGNELPGYGSGNVSSSAGSGGGSSNECFKCHQHGHWARDCPNLGDTRSGYGSGNISAGRLGNTTKQYVGGY